MRLRILALRYAHFIRRRLGVPGTLGAICALAGLAITAGIPSDWHGYRAARASYFSAARAMKHQQAMPAVAQVPNASEQDFTKFELAPQVFREIVQKASDSGIPLGQATYSYSKESADHASEFEMTCQFRARYLATRKFVQSVLNSEPSVGLRELSVTRASAAESDLDTHIRFVVFLRPSS